MATSNQKSETGKDSEGGFLHGIETTLLVLKQTKSILEIPSVKQMLHEDSNFKGGLTPRDLYTTTTLTVKPRTHEVIATNQTAQ